MDPFMSMATSFQESEATRLEFDVCHFRQEGPSIRFESA